MTALRRVVIPFVLAVSLISSVGIIFTASAQIPQHIWSQRFGDATIQFCESEGVTVDGSGNVIVTGTFDGTVDFGGGPLTSVSGGDIFVAKFDAGGNHIWSRRFGGPGGGRVNSVAVDGSGNVIVTGNFIGTMDFGGGPLTSGGWLDIFVAKFDADGNHIWSQSFGDSAEYQYGYSVAVDGSGNVIVTGSFDGTVDFGGGPLTSAEGSAASFIAKFDATGNHIWSQSFGNWAQGYSVAVDGSDNVIVTGNFTGTVDFGGGPLTSAGDQDIFVAKFDAGGNHIWSRRFGGVSVEYSKSVAVDGSGNVIVTGRSWGTVNFGGGPLTNAGEWDIFVAKFDAGGNHIWSQRFGDASIQYSGGVTVGGLGNVIVTGAFEGTVDFGGGPLTSAGDFDFFVSKFGANPSPTLLQSYFTVVNETGIETTWNLSEAGEGMEFYVLRLEVTDIHFQEIHNANIVRQNLSFTFDDNSCKPGLTYRYRVDVSDEDGRRILFETRAIATPALSLSLGQNYPNPFNPTTTISFILPERAYVELSIFNVDGKLIKTLVDKALPDGLNEVSWDGTDAKRSPVSSGVYLYRLQAGKKTITKKMVLLK